MASERDREIWDDATNAVCQAMQEQKMCNCPDGDCLAAKIDFSPEKIATATRPAPAATDTGLVRYDLSMFGNGIVEMGGGAYVRADQAEELLAAERARYVEASQRATNEESLKDTMHRGLLRWKERAEKAEANLEFIERVKGVNEKYANALAFLEMGENDDPEEFAECFWNKFIALEAKLAAAEKALTQLRSDCQSPIDMYERNGPEFTSPQGNEYESTSHVMAKFAELVAAIDAARAALGGKPSC